MNHKLIIRIKKRTQGELLIRLLFLLPFVLAPLCQLLHFPDAVKYAGDAAWMFLLLLLVLRRGGQSRNLQGILLWVGLFAVYTALVYLLRYQSVFYYLWGIRNNFRFYVLFFATAAYLTRNDVEDLYRLLDKVFWINFAVTLVQYFLLDVEGDSLGGIFGTESGCNGYTVIFHAIVVAKTVIFYLMGKKKTGPCLGVCVIALYISALAELKYFFVIFIMIVVLGLLSTKFSWRQLLLIVGGTAAIFLGVTLLSALFSRGLNWFSLEWFYETATSGKGYTSAGDINRLNAFSQINDRWLTDSWSRIFGLGLGNCDTAGFEIVNTPFFKTYGDMHYTWMSHAMMYLECGWIGLVFYFGFFLLVYFKVLKIEKTCSNEWKGYCRLARILAISCLTISIYNSSLRMESGYMAYFVLAVPFAAAKQNTAQ